MQGLLLKEQRQQTYSNVFKVFSSCSGSNSKKVFILPSLLTLASGWTSSQYLTTASLCGIPTLQVSSNKGEKTLH